jgi:hypothetical protein
MAHRGAYGVLDEDVVEDDPVAASPESPATPSVARGAMSSRMLGKHVGEVLNYLALLAWNRCVMHLVGGPTRTTIDVLMTRQFHGLMLVWTWAYTLGVSSACVAVVRWSAEKRASLEEKETERSRTTRDEASDQSSDVTQTRRKKMSVVGALLRSPLSPPIFTLRFKSFAHRRLQGACVFTCMWSLAVATLGTLPSNTVSDDVFSTLLLSFFFALVARNGAKGKGPLGPVLRVTTEADLFTARRRRRRGGRRGSVFGKRNVKGHARRRARDVRVDRRRGVGGRGETLLERRVWNSGNGKRFESATRGMARRARRGGRARGVRRRARRGAGRAVVRRFHARRRRGGGGFRRFLFRFRLLRVSK